MLFSRFAQLVGVLEKISSGNELRRLLSGFFRSIPKQDVKITAYLITGRISSDYESVNLGIAAKMVLRSIAHASKQSVEKANSTYKKVGDVGKTSELLISNRKSKLKLDYVFNTLHDIAKASGQGSQDKKIKMLSELLSKASSQEAIFISRIAVGNLRLGVGDKTVIDSLSIAFSGSKHAKKEIEHAFNICPDIGEVAEAVAVKGIKSLNKMSVKVGIPVQMMLCQRIKNLKELDEKIGFPLAVETKYDGERIQIHKNESKVTLYSRRLENISLQFPEIVDSAKKIKARTCIIEGEILAVDKNNNTLDFQTLMHRRRKHDIHEFVKSIPVCVFLFDCLYENGKTLINESYENRTRILKKIIPSSRQLAFAGKSICKDVDCVESFFQTALEQGSEGVVVKKLKGTYTPGLRGWNWIKWKPEYVKNLQDTFDLVVIGAYAGRGRRAGTYGALLCASYNDKTDKYESFCKLGSGFKDKDLKEFPKLLNKYKTAKMPNNVVVKKIMHPDVWFAPNIVVEVLGAQITRSEQHSVAEKNGKGLALRFPRFLRVRNKSAKQATTSREINSMV